MSLLRLYFHIARADLLERTRGYAFLISMLLVVYLGYAVGTDQINLMANGPVEAIAPASATPLLTELPYVTSARGQFNSAWIGLQMALMSTTFVSLIGFYLVKNCIDRDERTGVGQIIATTPLTSLQYLLGKWLSNLVVLTLIQLILSLASLIMQLFQPVQTSLDFWGLLSPMILLGMPMMSLTAALAVFFESSPLLRGGVGNLVYFFVWSFGLVGCIEWLGKVFPAYDPFGLGLTVESITPAVIPVLPGFKGDFSLGMTLSRSVSEFVWNGIEWTPDRLLARLLLFFAPILLVLLAALFFGRFDPARTGLRLRKTPRPQTPEDRLPVQTAKSSGNGIAWKDLKKTTYQTNWPGLVVQYLRLMLKGFPWWGYLLALGVWGGSLLAAADHYAYWLMALGIFPIFAWSRCGSREAQHNMRGLSFCAPHPLARLLSAEWTAAWLVTVLFFSGAALNRMVYADWVGLLALALGSLLIPAAALAFGVWSGSSKLFEVVYLIFWYLGPANHIAPLDFLGTTPAALVRQLPGLAAALVLVLLLASIAGRKRVISS